MKILFATDLEGDPANPAEKAKERWKFAGYLSAIHNMSKKIIESRKASRLRE